MTQNLIYDRFRGCLFGQAIGDALGLGSEFMTQDEVKHNYPDGLHDYSQIVQDFHRTRWNKGDWTDDTDMMMCIANAIIEDKAVCLSTIARYFKEWADCDPLGIGGHTFKVLAFEEYIEHPQKVAELIWKLSHKNSAANGGLMRTSVVGLLREDV